MKYRVVLALSAALLFAACDRTPEGQTVAVINDEEITATELNAELNNVKLPANADKAQARSQILQAIIDRRLLAQQARSQGLDTSPEFLNRQRRMNDELLISMLVDRQRDTIELPSAQEIARFEASRPEMFAKRELWGLQQIAFANPDPAVAKQLAATKTMEQLEKILTDNRVPFERGTGRMDTAAIPHEVYQQIARLPAGEPFIVPQGGRMIANVIVARRAAPLTGEQARTAALATMRREASNKFLQDKVKQLRKDAKIEYQPGYQPAAKPAAGTPGPAPRT